MHTNIIIEKVRVVGAGSTYTVVKGNSRNASVLICWTNIAGRNLGSKSDEIEIGLCRLEEQYILKAETPGNTRMTTSAQGQFYAPGDFVPYAEFNESDSGDVLELCAYGYIVEHPETLE